MKIADFGLEWGKGFWKAGRILSGSTPPLRVGNHSLKERF